MKKISMVSRLSIVAAALVIGAVSTLMKTPLYTSTVRLQIDRIAQALMVDGDGQMVDHGQGSSRLRNPQETLVGTIDGVVSIAE